MPEQNTQACLLCGEPLVYDTEEQEMECAICHRVLPSRARCRQGHFVCDDCHSRSALSLLPELCRRETSSDPWDIARRMMLLPQVHMHGPEHHVLVGLALLTAYQNAGGSLDLDAALQEMVRRGKQIPGGACGFLGCCGAAVSAGTFMALATGSTPLSWTSLGPGQPDDGGSFAPHRRHWRSPLLQTRFLSGHRRRSGLVRRPLGRRNGSSRSAGLLVLSPESRNA